MVDACKLLGVDVMTGHWEFTLGADRVKEIVAKDFAGKIDFLAQNIKTADFGDPVFPAVHDPARQRRAGRDRRPGVSVHADRQPAVLRRRLDVRHPGREPAEGRRRGARQGRAGGRAAVAQRDGRRPEARLARARHRRDPRRPHARRRPCADDRRQWRRHARSSPTPAATASSSPCSISTSRAARSPTSATSCCRSSPTCCPRIRRWAR